MNEKLKVVVTGKMSISVGGVVLHSGDNSILVKDWDDISKSRQIISLMRKKQIVAFPIEKPQAEQVKDIKKEENKPKQSK